MIHLRPTTQQEWESFLIVEIPEYARDHIRTGGWAEEDAFERATQQYAKLLPNGVETEGHHIFSIVEDETDVSVGFIWYEEKTEASPPVAFVCNLHVFKSYRRRGYATAALTALEDVVHAEHGFKRLQLHVFGHNDAARALYKSMDYRETNVLMVKDLG